MEQKITYNAGHPLAYAEYGDPNGFPILVQHGLIASIEDSDLFDRLIQLNTRLICIARPGYGRSSPYAMRNYAEWAQIISVLVSKLGLAHFDVLGISSGAPYAYSLGYGFPHQLRNIFIFSGTPALCDDVVRSCWPYPIPSDATIAEMQVLARDLFFSNLSPDELIHSDIRDSMMNNCFGVAQDLRLRSINWGFSLSDVKTQVIMRHSKTDDHVPYRTAVRMAELLPNCRLSFTESGRHFAKAALGAFIREEMIELCEGR